MATATAAQFLVEAPRPVNLEVEVLDSFGVRQKLLTAISDQELKRKAAELELARSFAQENRGRAIDAEAAFRKNESWRLADEHAGLRIAALNNIADKVNKLIERYTSDDSAAVKNALTKKLDEINKALAAKDDATNDLVEEKERIEQEIANLPKASGSTAAKRSKKR